MFVFVVVICVDAVDLWGRMCYVQYQAADTHCGSQPNHQYQCLGGS